MGEKMGARQKLKAQAKKSISGNAVHKIYLNIMVVKFKIEGVTKK